MLFDFFATLVAALLAVPALLLPGAALAAAFDAPGFRDGRTRLERAAVALVTGVATLPVLLDLVGRCGPAAMVALSLVLAIPGAAVLLRGSTEPVARATMWNTALALAAVFVLTTGMLVDLPISGGLLRSVLMADHVKHAVATWSIAESGTPPFNPTFYSPGSHTAYYYFFYTLTAVVQRMGCGVVAGRHAAFALTAWMAPALFAVARLVYRRAGLDQAVGVREGPGLERILAVLLLATGLQLVGVMTIAILSGGRNWIVDFEQWNTEVASWMSSLLWVPHHVAGLVAAMMGFVALAETADRPVFSWRRPALAGLAFASLAGLSIYVAIGAAATAALWFASLVLRRRWSVALRLAAAGAIAVALATPWLLTIAHGRAEHGAPIAFQVRRFIPLDVLLPDNSAIEAAVDLVALPLSYGLGFGLFAIGAIVFWRRAGRRGLTGELNLVLVFATVASVLVGSFLRSTILFNDLGWRVMLFAQFATLLWTTATLRAGFVSRPILAAQRPAAACFLVCLVIGFGGEAYGLVQLRRGADETPAEAALLPAERDLWGWMKRRLPPGTVVQPDPSRNRSLAYGLYGEFPTAVADLYNGLLFGGARSEVEARIAAVRPIFADPGLGYADAMAAARAQGIGAVVVTAADPVFSASSSWLEGRSPLYANEKAAVFAVPPVAEARQ